VDEQRKFAWIVDVLRQNDDGCIARRFVMQLDRPGHPELGDHGGKVLALPWSQRRNAACRRPIPPAGVKKPMLHDPASLDVPTRLVHPHVPDAGCVRQRDMPACDVSHTLPGTITRARAKTRIGALIRGGDPIPQGNPPGQSDRKIRPDVDQMLT
jgi:hypothetical protein